MEAILIFVEAILCDSKFSVSFGPKLPFRLWIQCCYCSRKTGISPYYGNLGKMLSIDPVKREDIFKPIWLLKTVLN